MLLLKLGLLIQFHQFSKLLILQNVHTLFASSVDDIISSEVPDSTIFNSISGERTSTGCSSISCSIETLAELLTELLPELLDETLSEMLAEILAETLSKSC